MSPLPRSVRIVEVGPRDGLQNESRILPVEAKAEFVRLLAGAGLRDIEIGSFVRPEWVPQMADTEALARRLPAGSTARYSALVPNRQGLQRAIDSGIRRIAVFTAASETFNRKNINKSIDDSIATFRPVVAEAIQAGLTVRGYVSTCFVCPYEGPVAREKVHEVAGALFGLGVDEVSIGDTIGAATPKDVEITMEYLLRTFPAGSLAMHFHDTYGMAVANIYKSLELGLTVFDSSAGGIGGCPYAPGAAGNVATEKVVYLLDRLGIESGIDAGRLKEAARFIAGRLGTS